MLSSTVGLLSPSSIASKLNSLFGLFFQEPRVPIRLLLLKVFGVLCGLDRTVIGILLASVLPNELGRDIQQDMKGTAFGNWRRENVYHVVRSTLWREWDGDCLCDGCLCF